MGLIAEHEVDLIAETKTQRLDSRSMNLGCVASLNMLVGGRA